MRSGVAYVCSPVAVLWPLSGCSRVDVVCADCSVCGRAHTAAFVVYMYAKAPVPYRGGDRSRGD
eukprot:2788247-Prymnesium_polylepis.1